MSQEEEGNRVTLIENVYYVLGTLHMLSYSKEGYGIREPHSHTDCLLKSLDLRSSSQMIKPYNRHHHFPWPHMSVVESNSHAMSKRSVWHCSMDINLVFWGGLKITFQSAPRGDRERFFAHAGQAPELGYTIPLHKPSGTFWEPLPGDHTAVGLRAECCSQPIFLVGSARRALAGAYAFIQQPGDLVCSSLLPPTPADCCWY